MYVPGERTLFQLGRRALQPMQAGAAHLGLLEAAQRMRRSCVRDYLAAQRRSAQHRDFDEGACTWARLTSELSESSGYFFSDNLVSNEVDSLSAAKCLQALPGGLAYLGVGPETMLSYLGFVRSSLAFIVDIRRSNALLHYLYRGLFATSGSRTEWLSLLLGRPYVDALDPGPSASIDDILAVVLAQCPSGRSFEEAQQRVLSTFAGLPPFLLPLDRHCMRRIHGHFFRQGPLLTFQLHGLRLRRYPTLAELLTARTPEGTTAGFLADENAFRRVQALELSNGVVPIVGSVQGSVIPRIAELLNQRKLQLGALYVSNVEQYVFENGEWQSWVENLRKLPLCSDAILIRTYFENEQGPVPDPPTSLVGQLRRTFAVAREVQRKRGLLDLHRMRTVVHHAHTFLEREHLRSYTGYRELVCDRSLAL